MNNKTNVSQTLLFPVKFSFSESDFSILIKLKKALIHLGFIIEKFSNNEIENHTNYYLPMENFSSEAIVSNDLISKGKKVYQFGFGQSPFPIPEKIVEALKINAHKKEYLPIQGLTDLREKISNYLDLSGGLETSGLKDTSKIDVFLNNLNKLKNET